MAFKTEYQLSESFLLKVNHIFDSLIDFGLNTQSEVRAPGGIPDYVIYRSIDNSIHYLIAIEFKLKNWNRALKQAFRYRNFANEVYVILDKEQSNSALANIDLFKRANIGLITYDINDTIEVFNFPIPGTPFSDEFSRIVASEINSTKVREDDDLPFIRTIRGGYKLSKLRELEILA